MDDRDSGRASTTDLEACRTDMMKYWLGEGPMTAVAKLLRHCVGASTLTSSFSDHISKWMVEGLTQGLEMERDSNMPI